MKNNNFILGTKKSFPIIIGYIPVAITFGILCKSMNLPLIYVFLSSFVLYSGAAQFMLVGFMASGMSLFGIAISIFLLNTRLFLMSASISIVIDELNSYCFPFFGWLLTDESFSVLSFNKDKIDTQFAFGVEIPSYFAWGIFSIVGFYIGEFLPKFVNLAMSMGLLGLFVALLVPNVKKNSIIIKVILISGIIYAIVHYLEVFTSGWNIVFSIIISSILGVFLIGDNELKD